MPYSYPTHIELRRIAQILLPRLMANRIVFADGFFPIRTVDAHALEWAQLDDVLGLQQGRGLNGRPARIQRLGGKRFMLEPGVYGEYAMIDEREITTRRPWGATQEVTIDISDLVAECQAQLLQRRLDRQEWIVWTLLTTGAVNVPAPDGAVIYSDQYTFQSFAASVPWATVATATPLADFRAVALKARGYSVSFNSGARAYMNQVTYNAMLSNINQTDIYGRRTDGLATINSPDQLNALLLGDGLPSPVVYDEGYKNDAGTFTTFIPDNKVVVIGNRRDGQPVGEYRMTRNANNAGAAPGAYQKVVDDPNEVPRTVVVHDGHSGGPVVYFPSAICVMTV
jgi:hypothetical protein